MSKSTKTFKNLTKNSVAEAGGKGASLGEMTRVGVPVPPGFVVLAGVFDEFLAETDLGVEINSKLKKVNYKDINSVSRVSGEVRDLIHDAEFPKMLSKEILIAYKKLGAKFVAVRSSATAEDSSVASWAGELESYLNTTRNDFLENIKRCWASLFTPRAVFYRYEKKLQRSKVSVAVVVQRMIQSEVSGICFTVHPVTEDKNQMVIEAGWGLGEAIVGGKITPDSYVISKKNLEILDVNVSQQRKMIVKSKKGTAEATVSRSKQERQKLSGKQIVDLAKICLLVEKHYRMPQDIEWGLEMGKFYILQSRPITTLS